MRLAEDLKSAREQVRHLMRYMQAAVKGARSMDEAERPAVQGIINHSGLARQTVYTMLGEDREAHG